MTLPHRFAARLNAFKMDAAQYWPGKNRVTTVDLLERAATVEGLNAADLNYPDHFTDTSPAELASRMHDLGMSLNGGAMRYYTDPGFKLGAFTHPDAQVRRAAIEITKRGIDAVREMGGNLMTLWMGQDGFDYSFQADYNRMWDDTIAAIQEVARHDAGCEIAIEYKPNEPRSYALMPDIGTTLLAIREAGADNLGVTLDFAHVLFADEMPAHAAALAARHSRILGVHLNDGYGKRDDGLMIGTVHPVQTIELLVELQRSGYDRAIYFDTFPDHGGLDPVEECRTNIIAAKKLMKLADRLAGNSELGQAVARQDAAFSQRIIMQEIYREV
ncbi:TIM barrel protein [Rhizobium sp. KVB221]|uniref:Xylose isomerase n=1 Tax=Rhizobium setariae TaxID=2801340 RepID=A0A936YNH4_9HYPH|nr:TIM barrel protein [Rhizobium setariae]MBL0371374.1 TIM barrel protein [Rhizobium setariae]